MTEEQRAIVREFKRAVNMTSRQLDAWLLTRESWQVGVKKSKNGESIGHRSGRRIVDLLEKKLTELDDDDLAHMRKVIGYIHRHLAQRPHGDVRDTHWRWSLMNWGHDPLRHAQHRKRRTVGTAS